MISERVQVLLTKEQRRRLQREARRRHQSVASLIREAIDIRFGGISQDERLQAAREISSMSGGRYLTPEQLNRIVEEEREDFFASA